MKKRALSLSPKDNVAVALEHIDGGDDVIVEIKEGGTQYLRALTAIPFGFKTALTDIPSGECILKYGEVIGRATEFIKSGQLVHIHNIQGVRVKKREE